MNLSFTMLNEIICKKCNNFIMYADNGSFKCSECVNVMTDISNDTVIRSYINTHYNKVNVMRNNLDSMSENELKRFACDQTCAIMPNYNCSTCKSQCRLVIRNDVSYYVCINPKCRTING